MSPHLVKQFVVIGSCLYSSDITLCNKEHVPLPLQSENEKSFVAIHTISS
jgi:hypothetical protein